MASGTLYAVLGARLSVADLSAPPQQHSPSPPWCDECDERTRMVGFYCDEPTRCPRCERRQLDPQLTAGPGRVGTASRAAVLDIPQPTRGFPRWGLAPSASMPWRQGGPG